MMIIFYFYTPAVIEVHTDFSPEYLSNVHELMTAQEKLQTFGTEKPSGYKVIPITLSGTRRKRQNDENINVRLDINGTKIELTLRPTGDYLATRYTPVWLATSNAHAYTTIRYDPLPNAMRDIGTFKMYQDLKNEAAITIYKDDNQRTVIEGIITSTYAIKSLPDRLSSRGIKNTEYHIADTSTLHKRSIESDYPDEETDYYVLFPVNPSSEDAIRSVPIPKSRSRRRSPKGGQRTIPEVVYPEILVVVDHNAIRHGTITQALRFVLAFWNSIAMVYSRLENPKIRLNIAGIIISGDDTATPYIANDTSIKIRDNTCNILEIMGNYFYDEQRTFPLNKYDIGVAMTTIKFCDVTLKPCRRILGYANFATACPLGDIEMNLESHMGVGIFQYDSTFFGVDTAVHEIAHLFGVGHDQGANLSTSCHPTNGFAMSPASQWSHQSFKWSPCSKTAFQRFFSLKKSQCLDNEPIQTIADENLLAGRWLSLDGQCRNIGYKESCRLPDVSPCMLNGCVALGDENKCEISASIPLPGSKCGRNKYCAISKPECIDETTN